MKTYVFTGILLLFFACTLQTQGKLESNNAKTVGEIPVPGGCSRLPVTPYSFAGWLRNVKLRKDKRVFLYDGSLKPDQSVQYAVLAERRGNKDLQQCADAIMRLRAEYFFSKNEYDSIHFQASNGTVLSFSKWRSGIRYRLSGNKLNTVFTNNTGAGSQEDFERYLETVFRYAGTSSLASELYALPLDKIEPGDIFIRPGFPGHAMIVVDVCINKEGKRLFMLAQSYMPAQDIHIVKNYSDEKISPWYNATKENELSTPEWIFKTDQLKRWKQ